MISITISVTMIFLATSVYSHCPDKILKALESGQEHNIINSAYSEYQKEEILCLCVW